MNWEPMDTAPRDNTPVLLLVDDTAVQGRWCDWDRVRKVGFWIIDVLEPYDVDTEDYHPHPTGWAPLPAKNR